MRPTGGGSASAAIRGIGTICCAAQANGAQAACTGFPNREVRNTALHRHAHQDSASVDRRLLDPAAHATGDRHRRPTR